MKHTTSLIHATDSVARACCYVAVVSLPLYFSLLTTTGFEPDKAVLIRALACVAGAAWLIGTVLRRGLSLRDLGPGFWAVIALFISLGLATVLSIDPRLSFWGSQVRQEGLVTWIAYLVFFAVAATRLTTLLDWERLVTALLLGSVPVAAYGYLQELGIDPVPVGGDPNTLAFHVRSTLGQHVFLGSYLVIVIPFALARFLESWRTTSVRGAEPSDWRPLALAAGIVAAVLATFFLFIIVAPTRTAMFAMYPALLGAYAGAALLLNRLPPTPAMETSRRFAYGALTLLLLVVLAVSAARGAWLSVLAGLPVFGLLVAWRAGRSRWAAGIVGVSVVAGIVLLLLNIPNGPLQPLRNVHALSRISNITESGGAEGSSQGRLLIWHGVGQLMSRTPTVGNTWGGPVRDLVGYGPETLHWAFQAVFPLKLRRVTSEIWTWDRSHDIYLDLLVDAGILALLAFLAVLAFFGQAVLRALRSVSDSGFWILAAATAAVFGHLVDGVFGIETPVTLLPLFLFFGLASQRVIAWQPAFDWHSAVPNREVPANPTAPGKTTESRLPIQAVAVLRRPAPVSVEVESRLSVAAQLAAYGALLAFTALTMLGLAATSPSPQLLAGLWIASALAGILAVAILLDPPLFPVSLSWMRSRVAIGAVAVGLAMVVALWGQYRYQTAAYAELMGLDALGRSSMASAIGNLQLAGREAPFEPQYRTDLGGTYLTVGANHLDTSDPTYVPSPADILTVDPTLATGFSRDQLFALALYSLQSARDLSPLDPDAYNNIGNLDLEWSRPRAALAQFQIAERLSHDNPRYVDQEALADLEIGKVGVARTEMERALTLDNTFWLTYYTAALIYHQMGAHAAARQAAAQSLAWLPNYWPRPPQGQIDQLKELEKIG